MTRKKPNTNIDDAVKDYIAGDSCKVAARRWNTAEKTLSNYLKTNGLFRSKAEIAKIKGVKISANSGNKLVMPESDIIGLYESGISEQAISKQFNVSRQVIKRVLIANNIKRRGCSESANNRWTNMTVTERKAAIANAQEWTRGKKLSFEHLCKVAKGVERNQSNVSASEKFLFSLLLERGIKTIPQKAVGKYNIDLAIFPLGIEVLGGFWHASKSKHIERTRYLFDNGWNMLFIWNHAIRSPITHGVAEYIVSYLDELSRNPTSICQYRVVRGDGQELSRGSSNDDSISIVANGFESQRGGRFDKIAG